jgi:hypothetical protein
MQCISPLLGPNTAQRCLLASYCSPHLKLPRNHAGCRVHSGPDGPRHAGAPIPTGKRRHSATDLGRPSSASTPRAPSRRHCRPSRPTRPRARSALIESGGFPLAIRCASLSALIRLGEAVDGESLFCGYAPAGDWAGGKWCVTAGGSRTLRSEPQYGGDLGEVLSRDRALCRLETAREAAGEYRVGPRHAADGICRVERRTSVPARLPTFCRRVVTKVMSSNDLVVQAPSKIADVDLMQ